MESFMSGSKNAENNVKPNVNRYSKELKDEVVGAIVNGELFLEEVMVKYDIEDRQLIIRWLRKHVREERATNGSKRRQKMERINPKDQERFDSLVQLAMDAKPSFFEKFGEAFPHFGNILKLRYPSIMRSELKFFAYLRLGLTSKEIAVATSVTLNAVERRKIRVRRKFDIPFRVKIYDWVISISEE